MSEKLKSNGPLDAADCSASLCECEKCQNYQRYLEWKRRANRALELAEDAQRDKWQIGVDLGLPESERLIHRFQRRAIFDLQFKIKEARRILNTDAPAYEQLNQIQSLLSPQNANVEPPSERKANDNT